MKKFSWVLTILVMVMASLLPISAAMDDFWGGIGGWACCDSNGDGLCRVGEAGLYHVIVKLKRPGEDGLCGTSDDVFYTSFPTDYSGDFFVRAPSGDYCLSFDSSRDPFLEGLYFVEGVYGPQPFAFHLREAEFKVEFEVGYAQKRYISGVVFNDLVGDGIFDFTDPLVGGATIEVWRDMNFDHIFGSEDLFLADFEVAENGGYVTPDILPGNYFLIIIPPKGWIFTTNPVVKIELRLGCWDITPYSPEVVFGIKRFLWRILVPYVLKSS